MGVPGPIGVIDGTVTAAFRQRPCQNHVTGTVIPGRGREVTLTSHGQHRNRDDQARRHHRSRP